MNTPNYDEILSADKAKEQLHETLIGMMMEMSGLSREECETRMLQSAQERREKQTEQSIAENYP